MKDPIYFVRVDNERVKVYRNGFLQGTLCDNAASATIVGETVQVVTKMKRVKIYDIKRMVLIQSM